jgi:hypothetical protein
MSSPLSAITSVFVACLLVSCAGNRDHPTPITASPPAPLATSPPVLPPAPEISRFPPQAAFDKVGYGCSLSLRRSPEDAYYLFYEANGLAVMQLNEAFAEFPSDFGATVNGQTTINIDNFRTMVSKDGQFTLKVNVTRGERIGEELTDIPTATLEVQAKNGSATAISAVGETGC